MAGKMILFSDIDGTFINDRYRFPFERSRMEKWFEEFRVVFVSSRTIEEIVHFHGRIGMDEDFIAENGAVICTYDANRAEMIGATSVLVVEGKTLFLAALASPIAEFSERVRALGREFGREWVWMHEMDPSRLMEINGYGLDDAKRACSRRYALLFDSQSVPTGLSDRLKLKGFFLTRGGKWNSISRMSDKGTSVRVYLNRLHHGRFPLTCGIGNSGNDRELLESVALRFVIRNPGSGYDPHLMEIPGTLLCSREGVEGFLEMMGIIRALGADHAAK